MSANRHSVSIALAVASVAIGAFGPSWLAALCLLLILLIETMAENP